MNENKKITHSLYGPLQTAGFGHRCRFGHRRGASRGYTGANPVLSEKPNACHQQQLPQAQCDAVYRRFGQYETVDWWTAKDRHHQKGLTRPA